MQDRLIQTWNYEADEKVETTALQNKINQLEAMLTALQNQASTTSSQEFIEGDYMNPIQLMDGGLITEKNKWYYTYDKEHPHMAIIEGFARPADFNDESWFYFN